LKVNRLTTKQVLRVERLSATRISPENWVTSSSNGAEITIKSVGRWQGGRAAFDAKAQLGLGNKDAQAAFTHSGATMTDLEANRFDPDQPMLGRYSHE